MVWLSGTGGADRLIRTIGVLRRVEPYAGLNLCGGQRTTPGQRGKKKDFPLGNRRCGDIDISYAGTAVSDYSEHEPRLFDPGVRGPTARRLWFPLSMKPKPSISTN